MSTIISHIYQDTTDNHWVIQSNKEHSEGVAKLASRFADSFGMAQWGEVLGLLHDKGKESNAFQQHIMKNSGYASDTKVVGDYHHAYVGAVMARNTYGKNSDNLFVNQILSHHTGLHDSDEIEKDMNKAIPNEVDTNFIKVNLNKPPFKNLAGNDFHHLSRMLYSCLVDADYLDTEAFMDRESAKLRGSQNTLKDLLPRLEEHLTSLKNNADKSEVNVVRNQVQQQCLKMSDSPIGFYSLTVPTGGGKTLSSLLWAMCHAIKNGQKRIIIAIPYTSIIMQTAHILRDIFGKENVLEHHSNVDIESDKNKGSKEEIYDETREKQKLATENWDYPIIVTTNVQLFESMFNNKPSVCRKLHNIVNSVIILDEVQTLPTDYLQPIVDSLKTYNKLFGVSVLFTTASQPILSGMIEGCNPKASFAGIEKVTEIIPADFRLHDRLRRVRLEIDNEGRTYDEVVAMLRRHKRVLCIVNTRNDAKELYQRLPQEGITLHLSRMMCPDHVSSTIKQIKKALEDDRNEIIRVVSTQLVEAGVDIDFPVVYRQETGLDSVLQAAGRCNREGKQDICTTYVFSLSKEHGLPKGFIQAANDARKNMIGVHDWFAPKTMTEYFKQLYHNPIISKNKFNRNDIVSKLKELRFATVAKDFQLIEDARRTVYVCWKDSMELVQRFLQDGPSYRLMKDLAKYSVCINKTDFKILQEMGIVSEKKEGFWVVDYAQQYDEHIGLRTDNNWANKELIV